MLCSVAGTTTLDREWGEPDYDNIGDKMVRHYNKRIGTAGYQQCGFESRWGRTKTCQLKI